MSLNVQIQSLDRQAEQASFRHSSIVHQLLGLSCSSGMKYLRNRARLFGVQAWRLKS